MGSNKEASLLLRIKTAGEDALEKIGLSIKDIGQVAATAFGLLSAVVVKSIADWREQEKATNALTQAMVNSGVYTKELRQDYLDQATALQKLTTFGDEQIISAQAALQQQIGSIPVTKELTKAVLDLATGTGQDLDSAAKMVGKSIGTNTNALARNGIEVDTNASSQKKLEQVLTGINAKFGGQAEAAAQGLGAITQLTNQVSDLSEDLGQKLAPSIGVVVGYLKTFAGDAQYTSDNINSLVNSVNFFIAAGIRLSTIVALIGDTIGVVFGALANNISAGAKTAMAVVQGDWAQVPALIKTQFETAKDSATIAFDQMATQLEARSTAMYTSLAALDDAAAAKKQEDTAKDLADTVTAAKTKAELQAAAAQEKRTADLEQRVTEQEEDLAMAEALGTRELEVQQSILDRKLTQATTAADKEKLLLQKSQLFRQQQTQVFEKAMTEAQKKEDETRVKNRDATLNTIATLQSSNNDALAAIGKAAALVQIAIDTPVAIGKALAAFPPPFNFAAAATVGVAMAAQAARVSGIKLADGGIVKARTGGVQATIGEGGEDEAVIPLSKMGGMGGGVNITVYGGLLGDQASAYQFAKAVDAELTKLRRNNDSQAFDTRIV